MFLQQLDKFHLINIHAEEDNHLVDFFLINLRQAHGGTSQCAAHIK